jgi:CHASE2 domain-containing sensor protein
MMKERAGSRIRFLGKSAFVVVSIAAISSLLSHAGCLIGSESIALDTLLRLKAHKRAEHVSIVGISETDYEQLFDRSSPLDPGKVFEVIEAIQRGNPAVVGVDLHMGPMPVDTAPDYQETMNWSPIVWALTPDELSGHQAVGRLEGLAVLPMDSDGIIRRHRRQFEEHTLNGKPLDSLHWAISKAYCSGRPSGESQACSEIMHEEDCAEEDLLLNFSGDRFSFDRVSAESVLKAARGPNWGGPESPFHGDIVLLGGLYSEARDTHRTPLGEMAGVELLALAIESELIRGGIRRTNELTMFVMEIAGGFLIVALYHMVTLRRAFWLSFVIIPLLAFASSIVSFYTLAKWANFVPVLVGTVIHQLYESAKMARSADGRLMGHSLIETGDAHKIR